MVKVKAKKLSWPPRGTISRVYPNGTRQDSKPRRMIVPPWTISPNTHRQLWKSDTRLKLGNGKGNDGLEAIVILPSLGPYLVQGVALRSNPSGHCRIDGAVRYYWRFYRIPKRGKHESSTCMDDVLAGPWSGSGSLCWNCARYVIMGSVCAQLARNGTVVWIDNFNTDRLTSIDVTISEWFVLLRSPSSFMYLKNHVIRICGNGVYWHLRECIWDYGNRWIHGCWKNARGVGFLCHSREIQY